MLKLEVILPITWNLIIWSYFSNYFFIDYAITVVLIFPLCTPSTQNPPLPQAIPHHCSCPWVMHISSLTTPCPILYFTSPWLFCTYLFVLLNPLNFSPIHPHSPPIWQPSKHSLYPWFCFCYSCLLSCFLDSVVVRFVFIAILLFIILIFFFFLNKSH